MGDIHNNGIMGDRWSAKNVAVGDGATIHDAGETKLDVAVEELLAAIAGYDGSQGTRAQMQAEADLVADELRSDDPDKGATLSRLVGIAALAGGAGTVATAVTNVLGALT